MNTKLCLHCNLILSTNEFYIIKNKIWQYCKKCESKRKKQQLVNFKKACLAYKKQFCCIKCGYEKCIAALDFHHNGFEKKEFNISRCKRLVLNDEIKSELDKCDVLCSNCHRESHFLENSGFVPKCLGPSSPTYCIDCNKECNVSSNCVKKWMKHHNIFEIYKKMRHN